MQQSLSSAISRGAGSHHSQAKRPPRFSECGQGPQTCVCGHPVQRIQGPLNQALATGVEMGFLGKLSQGGLRPGRVTSQNLTSWALCLETREFKFQRHILFLIGPRLASKCVSSPWQARSGQVPSPSRHTRHRLDRDARRSISADRSGP